MMGVREEPDWQTNAAFRETVTGGPEGRFPKRGHLVEMEAPFLDEVVRSIRGVPASKND